MRRLGLEQDRAAARQPRRDQVLHHLLLAVDRDDLAGRQHRQIDVDDAAAEADVEAADRACPRGAAARRRRARPSGRRCPAPARRRARGSRRSRGCATSSTTQSMPARCSSSDRNSPAGPAPTIPTCVRIPMLLLRLEERGRARRPRPACPRSRRRAACRNRRRRRTSPAPRHPRRRSPRSPPSRRQSDRPWSTSPGSAVAARAAAPAGCAPAPPASPSATPPRVAASIIMQPSAVKPLVMPA